MRGILIPIGAVIVLAAGGYGLVRVWPGAGGQAPPAGAEGADRQPPVIILPEPAEGNDDAPGGTPPPQAPLSTSLEPRPELPTEPGEPLPEQRSHLNLDLAPRIAPRPPIETLRLFDPRTGTRGFVRRHRVNDRIGLQAGIGYSQGEQREDRDVAAGLGVVFTY